MTYMQFKVKAKLMYKRVKKSKLATMTGQAAKGRNNSLYKKNSN